MFKVNRNGSVAITQRQNYARSNSATTIPKVEPKIEPKNPPQRPKIEKIPVPTAENPSISQAMKRLADKPPHKVYEWFRQWIEDASSSDDD